MGLQIEEQETHINWNRGDERVKIYTSDTTMMTKFNKLVETAGADWKREGESKVAKTGEVVGVMYSCPTNFISYRTKEVVRNLTQEQREEIRNRLHPKT